MALFSKLYGVSLVTVLEALRNRLWVIIGVLVLLFIPLSLPSMGLYDKYKLMANTQLILMNLLVSLTFLFFYAPQLGRELEERTLLPSLAKPISRPLFIVGRYLGGAATAFIITVLVTVAGLISLMVGTQGNEFEPRVYHNQLHDKPKFQDGEGLFVLSAFPKDKLWMNDADNHRALYQFELTGIDNPHTMSLSLAMDRLNIQTKSRNARVHITVYDGLVGFDQQLSSPVFSSPLFSSELYLNDSQETLIDLPESLYRAAASRPTSLTVMLRPVGSVYFISVDNHSVQLTTTGEVSGWWNYVKGCTSSFLSALLIISIALFCSAWLSGKMAILVSLFCLFIGNALDYVRSFIHLLDGNQADFATDQFPAQVNDWGQSLLEIDAVMLLKKPLSWFVEYFPDFNQLALNHWVTQSIFIENDLLLSQLVYVGTYAIPLLLLSMIGFQRQCLR